MRNWLISACCFCIIPNAFADTSISFTPFQSNYKVFRNGSEVGTGKRTFYPRPDGRMYFCTESKLKWFILSDKRKEQSWLTMTDAGNVNSLEYQYERTGTGPNKESHLIFNNGDQSLVELQDDYPLKTKWTEDLLDPVGYQLQMRIDVAEGKKELEYPVLYKGGRRDYKFEVVGEELLKLPIGEIHTVKLKRIRSNKKRETFVWLSKDHDFIVARIWQAKEGEEQADLRLAQFKHIDIPTQTPEPSN
ncbi:DUF3108 domain-containing protein [Echinimonas agarilytica]|uniref:DUF3108 domain-containing protein n=1 Tax=Echinimonas agarilytica TaxID=1215918 RepID=A0AA41W5L3_9GAMM|nr:DUF3108 domain-containing protein [Echinimonas agarilytica]MCM2679275.1 DUF3108 domain-containing protein [Echinimonas agarilytica]